MRRGKVGIRWGVDAEARRILRAKIDEARRQVFSQDVDDETRKIEAHHKGERTTEVTDRARAWAARALAEDPQLAWAAGVLFDEVAL